MAAAAAVLGLALLLIWQLQAYRPLEQGSYSWLPHADQGQGNPLTD